MVSTELSQIVGVEKGCSESGHQAWMAYPAQGRLVGPAVAPTEYECESRWQVCTSGQASIVFTCWSLFGASLFFAYVYILFMGLDWMPLCFPLFIAGMVAALAQ